LPRQIAISELLIAVRSLPAGYTPERLAKQQPRDYCLMKSSSLVLLSPLANPLIKVRARTSNGLSPYSNPEEFKTYAANTRIPSRNPEFEESTVVNEESNTGAIAGAAAGGAVILIMLVVFLVICTRKNTYHKGDKYVHELGVTDVTFHPVHPVGKNAAIYGMEHTPWLANTSDNQHQPNQELEVSQVEVGSTLRRATGNLSKFK
jgi:hypothetical protein